MIRPIMQLLFCHIWQNSLKFVWSGNACYECTWAWYRVCTCVRVNIYRMIIIVCVYLQIATSSRQKHTHTMIILSIWIETGDIRTDHIIHFIGVKVFSHALRVHFVFINVWWLGFHDCTDDIDINDGSLRCFFFWDFLKYINDGFFVSAAFPPSLQLDSTTFL
jgi:hypothetical protein